MATGLDEGAFSASLRPVESRHGTPPSLGSDIVYASALNTLGFGSPESSSGSSSTRHNICDFTATVTASIAGAAVYSISSVDLKSKALTLPLAAATGSVVEYSVKSLMEHLLLDEKERSVTSKDLLWGAVDALAGVAGGSAEKWRSKQVLTELGSKLEVSRGTALQVGKDLVHDSAFAALRLNFHRGIAGGAAAGLTWGLPRRIDENLDMLEIDPLKAVSNVASQTVVDTTFGALSGGLLSSATSTLVRGPELINRALAKFRDSSDITHVNIYSLNDLHSNLDQLPKIKTLLDQLIDKSHGEALAKGQVPPLNAFIVAGDPISGHVDFAFTQEGRVEYRALTEIGKKADVTVIGLGNHEYDAPGGRFNPSRFPAVIAPILAESQNAHLLNANLDFSAIDGFEAVVKRSLTVPLPNSNNLLGMTAVTTEEGALGGIKYNDALEAARQAVTNFNKDGVKFVHLTTHVGAEQDVAIAKGLLESGHNVLMSSGGHSHTILARLRWVSNKPTLLDQLQFWKPTRWIPNSQAGHAGRWLSVNDIAIKQNGEPDRWLSKGGLIPVSESIPDDPGMRSFLDQSAHEVKELRDIKYNARATSNYSVRGTRTEETPLGNLYADALKNGIQARAGVNPDIVLVHSGGIRSDLLAGHELTRLDLANVVMNAGRPEGEKLELTLVHLKGAELKKGLEFGVSDMQAPEHASLSQNLKAFAGITPPEIPFDPSGNFMQVSGMRYAFDLTKPAGSRVLNLAVKKGETFEPIKPEQEYSVLMRFHAIDKWHKSNVFGTDSLEDTYNHVRHQPVPVSQVDLLGDYITNQTLDPLKFSAVDGRIHNFTPPKSSDLPLNLGSYAGAAGALSIEDPSSTKPRF